MKILSSTEGKQLESEQRYDDAAKAYVHAVSAQSASLTLSQKDEIVFTSIPEAVNKDFLTISTQLEHHLPANKLLLIGLRYRYGIACSVDYDAAHTYFTAAAEKGSSAAKYEIALMYKQNILTPLDKKRVLRLPGYAVD